MDVKRAILISAALIGLLVPIGLPAPGASAAQPEGTGQADQPGASGATARAANRPDPDAMLARTLERLALMDLRLQPEPDQEAYAIADAILALAQRVAPRREELARQRAALAYRMGDREALEQATRQVIRLDRDDTVAQLRLITMRIGGIQTVEERLDAYDRFLGERGRSLKDSVRSRLALDAALLAREQGETDAFVRYLTSATQLDSTNKEAAAIAATYFQRRVQNDPAGRAELTVNLLLADPLDPNVHLTLARLLAKHGAFDQAARFHANGRSILSASQGRVSRELERERLVLSWHNQGPAAPVEELKGELAQARDNARERIEALEEQGIPTDDETPPEGVRLSPPVERVRILGAHAAGRSDVVSAALADLQAGHERALDQLTDPETRPEGLTAEQARAQAAAFMLEQLILRTITGDQASRFIDAMRDSSLYERDFVRRAAEPWVALHVERLDEAIAGFERMSDDDVRRWLGLGLARERAGRVGEAVEAYREAFLRAALDPYGAWSLHRAAGLIQTDPGRTTHTEPMRQVAGGVPAWVDDAARNPVSTTNLTVEAPTRPLGALDPGWLRLKLRNAAPAPLGVGAGQTLRSTFVIAPQFNVPGVSGTDRAFPEVVELDRRLRLEPRESIEVTLAPDAGFTGWFLEAAADVATRVRYQVIQGVRLVGGSPRVGPLSVSAATEPFVRQPLTLAMEGPEAVASALSDAGGAELAEALAAARTLAIRGEHMQVASDELTPVVDALIQRFPDLGPRERALALAVVPHAGLAPPLERFDAYLDEQLGRETDPLVLGVGLATRADAPDDPLLSASGLEGHPEVASLADRLRARFERGSPGYATASENLDDLTPYRIRPEPRE